MIVQMQNPTIKQIQWRILNSSKLNTCTKYKYPRVQILNAKKTHPKMMKSDID